MSDTAIALPGEPDGVYEAADARPVRRKPGLTALKWLGIALAGLLALLGAAVLLLDTGAGHRFLTDRIAALELENGLRFDVGRIDGSIYGDMVLHDLTVSDARGPFLSAPEVRLDWRPLAYLNKRVDIRTASARLVTLSRLPELKPTPDTGEPLLPDLDIRIGRLEIERLVTEAPVTDERRVAALTGSARIADRRAQVRLNGRTVPGASGIGGDRVALVLDAVPDDNRLALSLDLDAPRRGVVAALAGLDEPVRARLRGSGTWAQWNGRLEADLAGDAFARLTIGARNGTVRVTGPTRVARLFDGPVAALLGPILTVDMTGTMEERRVALTGNLASDAFRLAADGEVDLGRNVFGDMKLGFVLLKPSALAPNLAGSGLRARAVLDGPFATPRVAYTVNAARLTFGDTGVENLFAQGRARVDADQIVIPVEARASRITGLDTVAGGTLRNIRLNGDLAIDGARVLSDNMRLRSDRIDAGLILVADTARGFYTGAVDGRIDNYRIESVGVFDVTTDVDLRRAGTGFALQGRVSARSRTLFNSGVRNFLGGNAVASSNVRYGPDGIVRFTGLTLRSPAVRITQGSGFYAPDGRLELNARGATTAYGQVAVQVTGTLANPRAVVSATRPDLGIGLANLQARITAASGGRYRLLAQGDTDYGRLDADVVVGTGPALSLDINRANLAGIDFAGSLRRTPAGPFAGQLTANGQGATGIVRLGAAGRYQEALINLRARDTVLPGPARLAVGTAVVDARVVLTPQPSVLADVELVQTRWGDLDINAGRAKIDYQGGRGQAQLVAEGTSGVPFRINANAALTPELWRVAATGRVRGIGFATASPARIVPRGGTYTLLPSRIDFGRGNIRLAGSYGDGIRLQSRLDQLDLAFLNAFMADLGIGGTASGSLDFAQADFGSFPRADARLQITGLRRSTAVSISQPLDVNFVGKLLPDGGEARAVMRRRGAVVGRLVASLRPLPPGAGQWTTRLLSAPLSGGIRYNGPADTLFSFFAQPDQRLSGPIGVAADFSGRVAQPRLVGIVRANSLVYENQTYGTRLSNMAVAGRFSDDRLEIDRLTATAGDGTVAASGSLSLAAARGYPMDIRAQLANARLARSQGLSARATGELRLIKTAGENALLSGTLRLPETRYQLVREGAAEVPVLSGVRFKAPRGPARITGDERVASSGSLLDLLRFDLALSAPDELYVSGMGLESEWQAELRLRGTRVDPRVTGQVELVRGTLGFAGRSFELTRGQVDFNGGAFNDPRLQIVASDDIEDVVVNVNVAGRAQSPQITFSSVPGLPQDEILARILFGSSIGNLSAIQAVQLAASLNSLRSTGGGLNPLGQLRSATGIDRLRILSADERSGRGTALAAGQYITDDIYVEFITDARGFTATQLEISLTPFLSILSQAGGSGTTNVNVRYRKNY